MQCNALQKALKGVGTARGKVRTKAIASYIFHLMLIGQGRHGALCIFAGQGLVKKDKVREPSTNSNVGGLERLEIGLSSSVYRNHCEIARTYFSRDKVGDELCLRAFILPLRLSYRALQLSSQTRPCRIMCVANISVVLPVITPPRFRVVHDVSLAERFLGRPEMRPMLLSDGLLDSKG